MASQGRSRFGVLIMAMLVAISLSGCSAKAWKSKNRLEENKLSKFGKDKVLKDAKESGDYDSRADMGEDSLFSFGDDSSGGGIFGGGKGYTKDDIRKFKLFGGAVDTVMDLPIKTADRNAGFVSTEWKSSPKNRNVRYRLNIRVSGEEPYGSVKVVVLKQTRQGGEWVDQPSDVDMARQIQKTIRKRSERVQSR